MAQYQSQGISKGDFTFYVIGSYTQSVLDNRTVFTELGFKAVKSAANTVTYDMSVKSPYVKIGGIGSAIPSVAFDMRAQPAGAGATLFYSVQPTSPAAIAHNADGAKTVAVSYYFPSQTSNVGTVSGSFNLALPTIARATEPVFEGALFLGKPCAIGLPRADPAFTHDLSYSFGSLAGLTEGLAPANGAGASASFTPPSSLGAQIPNQASGVLTLTAVTKSGQTVIGSKTASIALEISPLEFAPSIRASFSEGTARPDIAGLIGAFVQGQSTLKTEIEATAKAGASIATLSTVVCGQRHQGASFTTSPLASSGLIEAVTTATDSRGFISITSSFVEALPYSPPSLISYSAVRSDSAGKPSPSAGSYMAATVSGSITPLLGRNAPEFLVRYKAASSQSWSSAIISGTVYEAQNLSKLIGGFPASTSFNIEFVAKDLFGESSAIGLMLSGQVYFRLRAAGPGAAFGKHPETDELLDVAWGLKVRGGLEADGLSSLKAVSAESANVAGGVSAKSLAVSGPALANSLIVSGETSLSGLKATGAASVEGGIDIKGLLRFLGDPAPSIISSDSGAIKIEPGGGGVMIAPGGSMPPINLVPSKAPLQLANGWGAANAYAVRWGPFVFVDIEQLKGPAQAAGNPGATVATIPSGYYSQTGLTGLIIPINQTNSNWGKADVSATGAIRLGFVDQATTAASSIYIRFMMSLI